MSDLQNFSIPDLSVLQGEPTQLAPAGTPEPSSGVDAVLRREHDGLMAIDGVVMVGEGQDEIGNPAIVVGVKRPDQLGRLPRVAGGVRVLGVVVGEVDALPASR